MLTKKGKKKLITMYCLSRVGKLQNRPKLTSDTCWTILINKNINKNTPKSNWGAPLLELAKTTYEREYMGRAFHSTKYSPLSHGGHIVPGDQKSFVLPRQASPPRFRLRGLTWKNKAFLVSRDNMAAV